MTFKNLIRTRRGYTLVELLATVSILGIVIAALYTFLLAGLNSFNRGTSKMDGQQSARIAMEKIVLELRYAVFVETPNPEEIRFRLKNDNRIYRFRKSGQEIVFESLRGQTISAHNKVAMGIEVLRFTVDEANTVSVTIGAGPAGFSLTSQVRPRNIP